jgi:hypothetical protein
MLVTAKLIDDAYYADEFKLFTAYGPLGIGKSAYSLKIGAELYGSYDKVKDYLVFHPKEFVEKCFKMSETHRRDKLIIWDDAGLWLFALEFTDPFMHAVMKYMNVARTNWAGMILTTPTPMWVIYKLRNFPQCINIKIIKQTSDKVMEGKPRIAKGYRSWIMPDFKKQGVRLIYEDQFNAMLPHKFYWDWYKPLRDSYAKDAAFLMKRELAKVMKKATAEMQELAVQVIEAQK